MRGYKKKSAAGDKGAYAQNELVWSNSIGSISSNNKNIFIKIPSLMIDSLIGNSTLETFIGYDLGAAILHIRLKGNNRLTIINCFCW